MIPRSVFQNLWVVSTSGRFGVGVGNICFKGCQALDLASLVFSHRRHYHIAPYIPSCSYQHILPAEMAFALEWTFWRVQCPVMWSIKPWDNLKKQKCNHLSCNIAFYVGSCFVLGWIPQDLTGACLERQGGTICITLAEGSVLFLQWRVAVQ